MNNTLIALETKIMGGLVRGLLMAVLGGFIASHGINPDDVTVIASAIGGLLVLVWSAWAHRNQHKNAVEVVTSAVHAVPEDAGFVQKQTIIDLAQSGKF